MGHLALDLLPDAPLTRSELLVAEYPGLLVDVALVHVGGKGIGAEVREQEAVRGGDQEVIWHQVLVHDHMPVAILQRQHSLDKVEPECE